MTVTDAAPMPVPPVAAFATGADPVVAFRTLVQEHGAYLWASLRRLGVAERDVEDVLHEVLLAVHARLDAYDPRRPMRPWLFAFAVRFASDYRRLARHHREVYGVETDATDGGTPADERLVAEQDRRLVLDALDALDLDQRAVLVLHDLDGCAMPDVARELGIPVNTAYTRVRAARDQFKRAVQRLRARRGER